MSATSNDHGRALECLLVQTLKNNFNNLEETENCKHCQIRDIVKTEKLPINIKNDMEKYCQLLKKWLETFLDSKTRYKIDRLSDDAAIEGDVTDICIFSDALKKQLNLSIKHNHNATKHQRIPALMQSLGISKGTLADIKYRNEYNTLKENILAEIRKNFPGTSMFNEIKNKNPLYIDDKIYRPLCILYKNYLDKNMNPETAKALFQFLIGNTGFYKCINYPQYVLIYDFNSVSLPKSYSTFMPNNSHIEINFDNGFMLNMRLHTASRHYQNLSLKFDTQIKEKPSSITETKFNK